MTGLRERIRGRRKVLQQRSSTRNGRLSWLLYLACVCHVVAAASLERKRSGISESGQWVYQGRCLSTMESCAAVSHAVV